MNGFLSSILVIVSIALLFFNKVQMNTKEQAFYFALLAIILLGWELISIGNRIINVCCKIHNKL